MDLRVFINGLSINDVTLRHRKIRRRESFRGERTRILVLQEADWIKRGLNMMRSNQIYAEDELTEKS